MVIENNSAKAVKLDLWGKVGLVLGVIGLIGVLIPLLGGDKAALQGYLYGYAYWFCLMIGCIGITLLHHTVRGAWGLSILRLTEAGGGVVMVAVMLVLSAPILAKFGDLYHWADLSHMKEDHILAKKLWYLNTPGFYLRFLGYFLIWGLYMWRMQLSTLRQDESNDTRLAQRRTNFAAPGLVLFVLTVTLASIDLFMSLDPHWFSSIWGFLFVVYGALAAFAFCNLVVMSNADKGPYASVMNKGLSKDLGNFMFMFTCLWAYFSFSQYIIIYSGNLPEFTTYYAARGNVQWGALGLALLVGHFLVPFITLLSPKVKATPRLLVRIAAWILVWRAVDLYWVIMPFMRPDFAFSIYDVLALVGVGGIWLFVFSTQVVQGKLLPTHDPRLIEAYDH
jgi:hypothetical protein